MLLWAANSDTTLWHIKHSKLTQIYARLQVLHFSSLHLLTDLISTGEDSLIARNEIPINYLILW